MKNSDKFAYAKILKGIQTGLLEAFDFSDEQADDAAEDVANVSDYITSPLTLMGENGIATNDSNTKTTEVESFTTSDGIVHRVVMLCRKAGTGMPDFGVNWATINIGHKERSNKYYHPNAIHWKDIDKKDDSALWNIIDAIRINPEKFGFRKNNIDKYPTIIRVTLDKTLMQLPFYGNIKDNSGVTQFYTLVQKAAASTENIAGKKELATEYLKSFCKLMKQKAHADKETQQAYSEYKEKKRVSDEFQSQMTYLSWNFFKGRNDCTRDDLFTDFEVNRYRDKPVELAKYIANKFGITTLK